MIDCVKVLCHLFVFNLAIIGAFLDTLKLFLGLGSGSKTFLGPTYID